MTGETSTVNIVGKYVDGLHVSIFGEPKLAAFNKLRTAKNLDRLAEFGTLPGVPGGQLLVKPHGRVRYPFVVHNSAIEMELTDARGVPEKMPRARIRFRAKTLYEHNLGDVETIVETISKYFLECDFQAKVSQFDYAVDFQDRDWCWPGREDFITNARSCRIHDVGPGQITGMTFGKDGSDLQVQIYNKSKEIGMSQKQWMAEIWATKETYDETLPVMRVELRYRRDILRELKRKDPVTSQLRSIDTISDLNSSIGDLVSYVVREAGKGPWFRVASPDTRHRKTERRTAAEWWQEISRAFQEGEPETGRIRWRSPSSRSDHKRALSLSITYVVKNAALMKTLELHPAGSPEDFLGPVLLEYLPEWLRGKGCGCWDEAVGFEVREIQGRG